jgi:hypothetical protein
MQKNRHRAKAGTLTLIGVVAGLVAGLVLGMNSAAGAIGARSAARGAGRHPARLRAGRPAQPRALAAGFPGPAAERQRAHLPR